MLVIVQADAGKGPQNEGHDSNGEALGHGAIKPTQVIMDDENPNQLDDEVKMTKERNRGVVNLALRNLRTQVIVSKARQTWKPARSFQPNSDLVQPVSTCSNLVLDALEIEELMLDQVEELWLVNETVYNLLV